MSSGASMVANGLLQSKLAAVLAPSSCERLRLRPRSVATMSLMHFRQIRFVDADSEESCPVHPSEKEINESILPKLFSPDSVVLSWGQLFHIKHEVEAIMLRGGPDVHSRQNVTLVCTLRGFQRSNV